MRIEENACDRCGVVGKELFPHVIIPRVKMIFLCEQCYIKKYDEDEQARTQRNETI
jgi:hypothetical protein